MICETCNKQGAYVQNLCEVFPATMCSECRREFHIFLGPLLQWKAVCRARDALTIYNSSGNIIKAIETKCLLTDMTNDLYPIIKGWVKAKQSNG